MPTDVFVNYAEKLELVFNAYKDCLDLDIALIVVPLNADERSALLDDANLTARIQYHDATVQRDMLTMLRDIIAKTRNDGVRLAALKELGRTVYPKRFKDAPIVELSPNVNVMSLPNDPAERAALYRRIIGLDACSK